MEANNAALENVLSADEQIDAMDAAEVKDAYVRVRLAREARGEYEFGDITEWLEGTSLDMVGTFANKLGLDVDTWDGDVVEQLWQICTTDNSSESEKVIAIRESLKADAKNNVGSPASKVLTAALDN